MSSRYRIKAEHNILNILGMLKTGDLAPEFSLKDQSGASHNLKDYKGKWVLIYFYPKDNTPGCTTEACSIRDNYSAFKTSKLIVLGISTDSVESHDKFATKYSLPFPILSDEKKEVVKLFGVNGFTGTNRASFLIDPKGKIAKVYEKVKPAIHAQEVLDDLSVALSS